MKHATLQTSFSSIVWYFGDWSYIVSNGNQLTYEFFLNYQQHKANRTGNYFFPCFPYVKIVIVTDKYWWDMLLKFLINNMY